MREVKSLDKPQKFWTTYKIKLRGMGKATVLQSTIPHKIYCTIHTINVKTYILRIITNINSLSYQSEEVDGKYYYA